MVRPQKDRWVAFNPAISYFKPRGIPMMQLEEVRLTVDEREAIRLSDLLGMSHEEAGRCMGVSRATFGRIIQKGRKTLHGLLIHEWWFPAIDGINKLTGSRSGYKGISGQFGKSNQGYSLCCC